PTVAKLSDLIERQIRSADGLPSPAISRCSRAQEIPLSFSQRRMWFIEQFEPGSCAYNIPRAFHIKGDLNVSNLQSTFNEIVRRHEILRTTFKVCNGE